MLPIFEKRRKVIAEIPNFWPTLFKLNDGTSQMLEEADHPVSNALSCLGCYFSVPHRKENPQEIFQYISNCSLFIVLFRSLTT